MGDWLRVRGGEDARLDVDDELTVGREQPGLGAVADDVELSRRHASFVRTDSGGLAVEDLGSTNGTFVNDKRISGRTELRPGDVVRLGATELEVVADPTTQKTPTPESRETKPSPIAPAPPPPPPPAAPAASAPRAAAPPPPPPPRTPVPSRAEPARRRDRRVPVLAVLLLLALAGLAAALLREWDDDDEGSAAVAAEPAYDGTAYVLSNRQQSGQNSVIAIRYGPNGFNPLRLREYPTKGVGTSEAGMGAPTDGDQQIQVDRKRKLLFAVNQGSDTVAVFRILDDGGLEHVKGSPFPSGGIGPISVGLSDATVLVVNKGYDGKRKINDPGMVAQFQLGEDGTLTPKGTPIRIDPGAGPPQALVIDRADIVVVPELITGPYRALRRGADGTFRSGPTTPLTDEQRALGIPVRETLAQLLGGADKVPKELPPLPLGTEGLSFHPEQDIMYSAQPPLSLLMVHEFDRSGRLMFVRGVKIQGGFLACWSTVSPDGRWLYVSNAGTHTIAVFDVRDPRNPLQVQSLMLDGGGGHTFNIHIDSTGKHLFVLDSFSSMFDRPGLGNQLHMLSIGQGGRLSVQPGGLARMPVSFDTSVYGLALVPRVTQSDAN